MNEYPSFKHNIHGCYIRSRASGHHGETVKGSISTTDAGRMRNLKGNVASDWMEAHMQIQSMAVMMGYFLDNTYLLLACYTTLLRKYNIMEPRVR
jgi:hypothetical protein